MQSLNKAAVALVTAAFSLMAARVDIVEGNPKSAVRVFIYDDLQCSECATLRTMLDEKLLPKYGARVAFVHRDLPLPRHNWARPAAIAGRWVFAQSSELGIRYRREILAEQTNITLANLPDWLREFAKRCKLSETGIVDSLKDPVLASMVDQDYNAARGRGVTKTPTVYIGNQAFVETVIYEEIAAALDVELGH
jgi:protein-disulfide isomerase